MRRPIVSGNKHLWIIMIGLVLCVTWLGMSLSNTQGERDELLRELTKEKQKRVRAEDESSGFSDSLTETESQLFKKEQELTACKASNEDNLVKCQKQANSTAEQYEALQNTINALVSNPAFEFDTEEFKTASKETVIAEFHEHLLAVLKGYQEEIALLKANSSVVPPENENNEAKEEDSNTEEEGHVNVNEDEKKDNIEENNNSNGENNSNNNSEEESNTNEETKSEETDSGEENTEETPEAKSASEETENPTEENNDAVVEKDVQDYTEEDSGVSDDADQVSDDHPAPVEDENTAVVDNSESTVDNENTSEDSTEENVASDDEKEEETLQPETDMDADLLDEIKDKTGEERESQDKGDDTDGSVPIYARNP